MLSSRSALEGARKRPTGERQVRRVSFGSPAGWCQSCSSAHRAQGDALELEAGAKHRLADEYDQAKSGGRFGHSEITKLFLEWKKLRAANSDGRTVDGSDTAPRIVRRLRIRRIVAQPDTEGVSRRWDNSARKCRCHSHGCTTHHEPGAPNCRCLLREQRRQGEQRGLQQRL